MFDDNQLDPTKSASKLKEEGNKAFQNGDHKNAIAKYTGFQ